MTRQTRAARPVANAAVRTAWWLPLAVAALITMGCSDNPVSGTAGLPATIDFLVTMVGIGQPPVASIATTVRDVDSRPVSSVLVNFSTSEGFITTGAVTGADGVAVALLTGVTGTAPTVTANVTADAETVTASTVVRF